MAMASKIRVEACAICGSDVKTYNLGNPRISPPRTMGHEFCGTIESLGDDVGNYRVGQRVTMATTIGLGIGQTAHVRSSQVITPDPSRFCRERYQKFCEFLSEPRPERRSRLHCPRGSGAKV